MYFELHGALVYSGSSTGQGIVLNPAYLCMRKYVLVWYWNVRCLGDVWLNECCAARLFCQYCMVVFILWRWKTTIVVTVSTEPVLWQVWSGGAVRARSRFGRLEEHGNVDEHVWKGKEIDEDLYSPVQMSACLLSGSSSLQANTTLN
jgi:hypothetical protein